MQSLKFAPELVPLVLSGEKTSTWRLFNEKHFIVNEIINLIKRPELIIFAKAKIISINIKKLGEITDSDYVGHEKFESTEKMYEAYRRYYHQEVDLNTEVTIIRFKLVNLSN
jgi:hypothetical protein